MKSGDTAIININRKFSERDREQTFVHCEKHNTERYVGVSIMLVFNIEAYSIFRSIFQYRSKVRSTNARGANYWIYQL